MFIRGLKGKDRMYAIVLRYKRPLSEVDKHVDAHRRGSAKTMRMALFSYRGANAPGPAVLFSPLQSNAGSVMRYWPAIHTDKRSRRLRNHRSGPEYGGRTIVFFCWARKKLPLAPISSGRRKRRKNGIKP